MVDRARLGLNTHEENTANALPRVSHSSKDGQIKALCESTGAGL
ncbi:Uncharacterized protein PPKH_0032 [Pseudomonas putida]|nr:Uncharacterized protein PPKH_0032 [Pseudomonas putida]